MKQTAAVLILDVDGVLSAVGPTNEAGPWGDAVVAGRVLGPAFVSPTLSRRLDDLAATPEVSCLWLTSWDAEMRANMDPFPGRDWPSIPTARAKAARGWWKWKAVAAWLDTQPQLERVAWCDDHLAPGRRQQVVRRRLADRGVDGLLIAPSTTVGLTPHHMGEVEAFLRR